MGHQARISNSPATTLSQRAADASPATTARCPLASTSSPNSPCFRSPKASTQRSCTPSGTIELAARVESGREYLDGLPHSLVPDGVLLRCVDAFGDLKQGEFGLLVDANGHLAVVAGEASAARWLNVVAGELLILAW